MESVCARYDAQSLYRLAASAEQLSEHPPGKAIVRCCRKTGAVLAAAEAFEMLPGRGVRGRASLRETSSCCGRTASSPALCRLPKRCSGMAAP